MTSTVRWRPNKFTRTLSHQQRSVLVLYGDFALTLTAPSFAADPLRAEPLAVVNGEQITAKGLEHSLGAHLGHSVFWKLGQNDMYSAAQRQIRWKFVSCLYP